MKTFDSTGKQSLVTLPGDAKKNYWTMRAALLDPDAMFYTTSPALAEMVPAGEVWYVLNAWSVQLDAVGGGGRFFHRRPDTVAPWVLGPGDTILNDGSGQKAFIYVCKPSLVVNVNPKYADPESLFYERWQKLQFLAKQELIASVPASSTVPCVAGTEPRTAFPADFTNGIVLCQNQFDVAWLIMRNYSNDNAINLWDEFSDVHPFRHAGSVNLPFKRTTFTHIAANPASANGSDPSLAGEGSIIYVKTPEDGSW